jgi:hypothetical protein
VDRAVTGEELLTALSGAYGDAADAIQVGSSGPRCPRSWPVPTARRLVSRNVVGAGVSEHVRGERVLGHLVGGNTAQQSHRRGGADLGL